VAVLLLPAIPAAAELKPFPASFHAQQMPVTDGTQYVRIGGQGPAVLLLHGFGDTGDMWEPLAEVLVKDHTVIIPDLRGMGLSSHPEGGYEKVSQARDIAAILDQLKIQTIVLVTHDIGNMVGYALATASPNGSDTERLVAGRERILLDRFYNDLSDNPAAIDDQTRDHYAALYARPGAIHDAFSGQFAAFAQDAQDNKRLLAQTGKLPMPVLAIGGDHSYGASMQSELAYVASNVQGTVITNSGHWIMEEQPQQAIGVIVPFIENK
jgi:pimeloyl-ACP methyl ester carboxylesterase